MAPAESLAATAAGLFFFLAGMKVTASASTRTTKMALQCLFVHLNVCSPAFVGQMRTSLKQRGQIHPHSLFNIAKMSSANTNLPFSNLGLPMILSGWGSFSSSLFIINNVKGQGYAIDSDHLTSLVELEISAGIVVADVLHHTGQQFAVIGQQAFLNVVAEQVAEDAAEILVARIAEE